MKGEYGGTNPSTTMLWFWKKAKRKYFWMIESELILANIQLWNGAGLISTVSSQLSRKNENSTSHISLLVYVCIVICNTYPISYVFYLDYIYSRRLIELSVVNNHKKVKRLSIMKKIKKLHYKIKKDIKYEQHGRQLILHPC